MKLYLDNIVFYLQNFGGISVYWNEILKRLETGEVDTKFIEIVNAPTKFKERTEVAKRNIVNDRNISLNFLKYLPISKKIFENNSILHSSYFRFTKKKNVKNIITIYDFTYEYYIKGLSSKIHHFQKSQAIKNATGIICISENTKNDLLSFYPNLVRNNIKVIYLASTESYFPITNIDISTTRFESLKGEKILSFVGKRIKYKNFSLAVSILKNLPNEYHLMIIGGGNLNSEENEMLSSVKDRFSHFTNVNSEELNIVYNISFCYLYLSEYEGFGIPVLEAMQVGCPVLCQNISSIPEVYGKVDNILLKKNNIEECCENILKLESEMYRKNVIQQGKINAGRFSWDETFKQTLDFYRYINSL